MKIKKSYPIDKLSDIQLKKLTSLCHISCITNMGINRRKKSFLNISIEYSSGRNTYGEYDPFINHIKIFTEHSNTIEEFVSTFIHEYTHYLQPTRTKYHKLLDEFGYVNHPFEIQARENEIIYSPIILRNIIKLL